MSTLDTLAHELRVIAGDDGDWVAGPISASVLREAADTIESLRDRLQTTTETCHWEYPQGADGWAGYIVCSACGHQFSGVDEREWTCCPCCRREIKGVDA